MGSEPVLFRLDFEDPQQLYEQKVRSNFAFCSWQMVRQVLNESGFCHAEVALFYRDGVIANISAFEEQLQAVRKKAMLTYQKKVTELQEVEQKLKFSQDSLQKALKAL